MRAEKIIALFRVLVSSASLILTYGETARAVEAKDVESVTGPHTAENAPPRVEIAIVGDPGSAAVLGTHIVSWFHGAAGHASASTLQSLDSTTVFAPTPETGVRVWVLLRSAASARLVFAVQERPNDAPRYLVNDVALDSGLDELGMEHLGQVVYLSAMALWAGNAESSRQEVEESLREAQPPKPKLEAKAPPPVPVKRSIPGERSRASFRLGLELADRFGDEGRVIRGALALSVFRARQSSVLGGALHVEIPGSTTANRSGLNLAFTGESARFGLLYEGRVSDARWYGVELGPGLDVVRYHATPAFGSTLQPNAGGRDVRPTVYASFYGQLTFYGFSFQGGFLVLVPLEHTHYDISGPNGSQAILTPWPVQPGFFSGLYW